MSNHETNRWVRGGLITAVVVGFGTFLAATGVAVIGQPDCIRGWGCKPPDFLTLLSLVGLLVGFVAAFIAVKHE
jgi:hypothetical protein